MANAINQVQVHYISCCYCLVADCVCASISKNDFDNMKITHYCRLKRISSSFLQYLHRHNFCGCCCFALSQVCVTYVLGLTKPMPEIKLDWFVSSSVLNEVFIIVLKKYSCAFYQMLCLREKKDLGAMTILTTELHQNQ